MKRKPTTKKIPLRNTSARNAVLDIFESSQKPIDVSHVLQKLKQKSISVNRATVFRIINLFTQKRLLNRIELSEGKFRYELASLPHHHHAVCTRCKSIQDLASCDITSLEKLLSKQLSFAIQTHRLEFFGLCRKCQ